LKSERTIPEKDGERWCDCGRGGGGGGGRGGGNGPASIRMWEQIQRHRDRHLE